MGLLDRRLQHWQQRGGDPAAFPRDHTIVDVPPGTYRFAHHSGERGFEKYDRTAIYTHITRIA